ncbi:MAG: hypothetical protein KAH32_07510, partial [Chlamydiia bacterium]|nr:hypothetical protein [Chlamydiia bacterium]
TFFGVDYLRSIIWMYGKGGFINISDLNVKTVILNIKAEITKRNLAPRVYSSYDNVKHNVKFSFAGQDLQGHQTHIGTLMYSSALKRWVTRLTDGTKFSFDINSRVFDFGWISEEYADIEEVSHTSIVENSIWEKSVLDKRSLFKNVEHPYSFEIVINQTPQVEKILDNLVLITNKVIPNTIIYTTSGESSDSTLSIWSDTEGKNITVQDIIVRGVGSSRMALINQNAYYKNSGLYIEVSKTSAMSKTKNAKRIRDKYIRIKILYTGTNETFIQTVLSMLSISYG